MSDDEKNAGGGVALWLSFTAGFEEARAVEACRQVLSISESMACQKLRRNVDGRDYAIAHALLRGVLSQYLKVPPPSIEFEVGPFGKPQLPEERGWLQFSLAHTTGLVVVAVRSGRAVGVDVEGSSRRIDVARFARTLAPAEAKCLGRFDGQRQQQAFLTLWTVKEAYVKARGMGLSLPLDSFDVELSTDGLRAIALNPAADDPVRDWFVKVHRPCGQYVCAVATPDDRSSGSAFTVSERVVRPEELLALLND